MNMTPIAQSISKQGDFLFRWRSYIPLALLAPGLFALHDSIEIDNSYGETVIGSFVVLGFLISLFGLFIRWMTVGFVPAGTSGRNTKNQRAHHLNTDGLYSIVRNPLYLGNFFAIMGVLVSIPIWWLSLIGALSYWIYIERVIAAEERFLINTYDQEYIEWAKKTPAFIPNVKLWRAPTITFSFKTVLRREYNGLMGVCSAFIITEAIKDVIFKKESLSLWIFEDWPWMIMFIIGTILFFILRTLKKSTRVLHVKGR